MSIITFTNKGIYCPQGKFYIDPWLPVDHAVITHGHADHARRGSKHYLCHKYTEPILRLRIDPALSISTLDYNETIFINGVKLSMFPAGHIVGSAQIRLEYEGYVAVISGDYKTEYDGISTAFEPVRCNEFVTESTFGLPIYNWLPQHELFGGIRDWIANNQLQDKTSVFIAYSLGKAQRLMKGLEGTAKLFVHNSINNLNKAIESNGIVLPQAELVTMETPRTETQNQVVILPPALLGTNLIKKLSSASVAICSGWMQVRGSRRWQAADAGFAVSDHADWSGLLSAIKATGAEKVYVTHGSTATFSKYLNEIGIEAAEVATQYGKEDDEEIGEPKNEEE
ncbi:ligase-associated DNA damage response exonuclease [Ferruginibacter sp. HRS2-29]|uniref:ligase-associated DNA damage response exonuclease n=1 Tax=Ferruginibacter sp. HRS2-29 TaxID=2487334 RepID=UPI0020CB6E4E|nr:ligase-associated DNA damage response exonuclease [Ferruginibacter sp. HRS2-29]MCP9752107.1 ligase-associated DNA damage response exonuclease [Ferruginibacter sp. HRS2-29]